VLGLVMAFGAGVLISAVAYELVQEAFHVGAGSGGVALGLVAGAAAFYCGDLLIDRLGGQGRKSSGGSKPRERRSRAFSGSSSTACRRRWLSLLEGGGVSVV